MEEVIRFRIAKPSDAKQIANLHWHVRDRYDRGITLKLGKKYLKNFYKIVLNDPWEILICAENQKGDIIGFNSISIDPKSRYENLRKHKFKLGFAALSAFLANPKLIYEVLIRYNSVKGNSSKKNQFIHIDGPRSNYWCWKKGDESLKSVDLTKIAAEISKSLGVEYLYFEVDKENKQVYKYHTKVAKSEIIEEIILPDGRERVLFRSKL